MATYSSLFLSLSLSLTHTHTHTLSLSLSFYIYIYIHIYIYIYIYIYFRGPSFVEHRFRAKRERLQRFEGTLPESQGPDLVLTVLYVPCSRLRVGARDIRQTSPHKSEVPRSLERAAPPRASIGP